MMRDDFSKNEECLSWLESEYVMLGRSIYAFFSGIESDNPALLQTEQCSIHYYNVICRLTTMYKVVTDLNPDEEIVFESNRSVKEMFEKNNLRVMTISDNVESIEKPILDENQDFHPVGSPFPFSSWFHEKTNYLADSFIFIAGYVFDHDRKLFDTEWLISLIYATKTLQELLCFFERKAFRVVGDYSDNPFSIEGFFTFYGFGQKIKKYNPDSDYWKEMKAEKGVKKFLKKWDSLISIPIEDGGKTLLSELFYDIGFKDIRIGELRRNLDKVSFGEKKWEDFLAESVYLIEQLRRTPYDPGCYGYDSFQEQIDAENRKRFGF